MNLRREFNGKVILSVVEGHTSDTDQSPCILIHFSDGSTLYARLESGERVVYEEARYPREVQT